MGKRKYTAYWLAIVLLLLAGTAEAGFYAITATNNRDGQTTQDAGMYADCPNANWTPSADLNDANEDVGLTYILPGVLDWPLMYRIFYSFSLANVSGSPDSARVKLVVKTKASTDWPQGIEFYYGGPCVNPTNCTAAMGVPWEQCADALITVPADDIPGANDSMYVSVTSAQIGDVGSGKCFDLRLVATSEDSVCYATGSNAVQLYMSEESTVAYRPVLYVWTTEAAAHPAIIDIDPSDIDLSNPRLIGGVAE